MLTTNDLRDLLHDQADTASTARPPVDAALRQARRVRVQRRVGAGVTAFAAAAAIAVPMAVGWPGEDRPPAADQPTAPGNERVESSSGFVWAPTVPGLDLPEGDPLQVPYAFGSELTFGSEVIDLGGTVRQLVEVPGGLVALADTEPRPERIGSQYDSPTRVVYIRAGAQPTPIELDRGFIWSVQAKKTETGVRRVVWAWTDVGPDEYPTELRAADLDAVGSFQHLELTEPAFLSGFHGDEPLVALGTENPIRYVAWDVDNGTTAPVDAETTEGIDRSRDGKWMLALDNETSCSSLVAASAPGVKVWERCDVVARGFDPSGTVVIAEFSETGDLGAAPDGLVVLDLLTGADLVTLQLAADVGNADGDRPPGSMIWRHVLSWEPDGSAIVELWYTGVPGEDPDTNFAPDLHSVARCSVVTGGCELIPHPVEVVSLSF